MIHGKQQEEMNGRCVGIHKSASVVVSSTIPVLINK